MRDDLPRPAFLEPDDADQPRRSVGVLRHQSQLVALQHRFDRFRVRLADPPKQEIHFTPRRIEAHVLKKERWDDGQALEETVMRGASRFRDPGRGQGLAGGRRFVGNWDGKLSIRSGTARIAVLPKGDWDEDEPLVEDLSYFPGAQVQITIPERVA